jgi:trimeric autotransporter adhesin
MDRSTFARVLRRLGIVLLLTASLMPMLPQQVARAAPLEVTNCGPSGLGSLAQAVADANTSSGETIVFGLDCQGSAVGTSTTAGKIVPSGPLTLNQSMTVDATGHTIVVDGNNAQSVFVVNSGVTVTLKGLTIQHGSAVNGGGVDNEGGTLTVANSTLSGNAATNSGGGIRSLGGALTVSNSTLSGNTTTGSGGGIDAFGTLTVTNSTLSGNTATGGGGGGIEGSGTLSVTDSTLSGNSALNDGGALDIFGGDLTVTNSTLSGNVVTNGGGGGIFTTSGRLTVTNSTVSGNSVSGSVSDGGGIGSESGSVTVTNSTVSGNTAEERGGGIFDTGASGGVALSNTIVAGNSAGAGPDLDGFIQSGGYNVIGNTSDAGGLIGTDLPNVDPKLDPAGPTNHGGPTPTIALLPTSPAIDLVPTSASCPATDQRGTTRPQGTQCDSGAFEYVPVTPILASPQTFGPAAGGIVTFGGSGFQTGTALILGGGAPIPASTVAADGSSFTVTVPAHTPGDVTAVVTNPGGLQATATFTYSDASLISVAVTPTSATLAKGQTQSFIATGTFTDSSARNLTSSVIWASSDTTKATIANTAGANGLATAVGTGGSTTITASMNGVTSNTATLTVTAATLTSIAVTPGSASVPRGGTQQFTATGTFSDGTTQDLTATATWASNDTAVAANPPNGLATGANVGAVTITARLASVTSPGVMLTVTDATLTGIAISPTSPSIAIGTSQQFTAIGTYSDASTANITSSVPWQSSDRTKATINAGKATGIATGNTTITASLNGVTSNTASLTVTAATLTSIAVTPANPVIAKGTTRQFTATGTFSDGTTQDLTTDPSLTWQSDTAGVATIASSGATKGQATAVAPGTARIIATRGSVSGSTVLTVTNASLASIAVTPANASIVKGATQQFAAMGAFTDGSTADLTSSVTWVSSNQGVATISNAVGSHGVATAVAPGTTAITATEGGVTSNSAALTVPKTLQSIAITPANPVMKVGATVQLTATVTYSDGTTQDLTAQVQWSSSAANVASVDASGKVTGKSPGVATIQVMVNGVTGSTQVTVGSPVIVGVSPAPAPRPSGTGGVSGGNPPAPAPTGR